MSARNKVLVALGSLVGLILVALMVVPVLFRDRIEQRVRTGINEAVEAEVAWSAIGLTFFRNFPNLTFRLADLTVTGVDGFEGDTLATVGDFRLVLDVGSVVRGLWRGEQIVVRSIEVNEPVLHLTVLEDGRANWDIARPDPDAPTVGEEAPRDFNVGLKRLEIRNGRVVLDNREAGLFASLEGLQHTLSGDFTRDLFDLRTRTRSDEVSVRFAGVPYLTRVRLDVDADLEADMVNRRFTFAENRVRLNDLALGFSGFVAQAGEDVELDMVFDAPAADFKQIVSLVPAIYARDFETLETSGTVSLGGRVTGMYGQSAFPALALNVTVDDAMFRYPDLPLPASDIFVDLSIDNPGGDADNTVVNLRRLHVMVGNEPIDAAMVLRTPVSDPDVDLRLAGQLDLAALSRTIKLEGMEELSGVITADVQMRTRMSYVDEALYDRIEARGGASVRDMTVRSAELPHAVAIEELLLELTPRYAEMRSFRGRIGSSDVGARGYLDNLLGFALRDEDLRGRATVESRRFVLDEWRSEERGLDVIPVPANVDFTLDATVAQLLYGDLEMSDARGRIRLADRRLTLEDFRVDALDGRIAMTGFYETTDVARPTFDLDLRIDSLDIPSAFATFVTVRALAPVARWASGRFSSELQMSGALGEDMTPLFDALSGRGGVRTSRIVLQDFPPMHRLAESLRVPELADPALEAIRAVVEIRDGRLHVRPFEVRLGTIAMTVSGSNGVDQSLQYDLALEVPRAALGSEANRVVADLLSRAGRAGVDLQAADVIELAVRLTGTVGNPSIETGFAGLAAGAREEAERAVEREVERRLEAAEERVDEAREEARRRAELEAERLVRDAEERAAAIREEARELAERVRGEGHRQADELLARADNPVALAVARPAADRLRREADERADEIVREADRRAEEIVSEARQRADELRPPHESS